MHKIEGSVAFGLTSAIYGEITIRNGRVVERNFDDYQILRLSEMPKVETHWILSQQIWGGISQQVTKRGAARLNKRNIRRWGPPHSIATNQEP